MSDSQFYRELQKDAEQIVEKAVAVLHSYTTSFQTVHQKDEGDMATTADIEAEKLIINEIKNKYPHHGIYSEEAGELQGTEPYTWIIDPLDGTKEYTRHSPEYNCLIAVEHTGLLVTGVMKRVGVNETYSCSKGNGAYINGQKTHVSTTDSLDKAILSFYLPNKKFTEKHIYTDLTLLSNLIHTCYRIRGNNDEAKAFSWVGRGIYDGDIFVTGGGKWHDVAPGILFVQEAGGKVTDWEGNMIKDRNLSNGVVASNGILHGELLKIVNQTKEEV